MLVQENHSSTSVFKEFHDKTMRVSYIMILLSMDASFPLVHWAFLMVWALWSLYIDLLPKY